MFLFLFAPLSSAYSPTTLKAPLPLLPLELREVPLVGETQKIALSSASLAAVDAAAVGDGYVGCLLRTSRQEAVSWTPVLQVPQK